MKILNVIETAYRATIEEQDDPAVWITHAMKGAGGDLSVLLRGNAVNYAVKGQDGSGLSFGSWHQVHPAALDKDIESLIQKGVTVYVVEDDVAERGLERHQLCQGVEGVSKKRIHALFDAHDAVWHW